MSDLMAFEYLPDEGDIRITVEFTGAVGYFVNGVVPYDDIHVRAARADAKMAEIGVSPQDRPGFARDLLTRLSLIPPANGRQAEACIDLVLWIAERQGLPYEDDPALGDANWIRLRWSALMDENAEAPQFILDHCPALVALWNTAA